MKKHQNHLKIKEKNMKLSFVIPSYNEEKNIGKCLQSIIKDMKNKKYDIEIIVVNNASTDQTKKIAESFSRVKVVDEQKKGIVWARRAGYLASSGDLIANIDADTILLSGWIDKVYKEFEADKNLVAFSGPFVYYDLPVWMNFFVKIHYLCGYILYLFTHYLFNFGAMLQGGNYVVKRSALEKIGGYNTSISFYGEDADIGRRISKTGHVKFDFKLKILTSGRRLSEEGILRMALRYGINHIWINFFKKPFTMKYKDVRKDN